MNDDKEERGREVPTTHVPRLTFKVLMAEARKRATAEGTSSSVVASNEAALRNFARAHECQDNHTFSGLLGMKDGQFDRVLRLYEDKATVSAETVASYRSRLRSWNAVARHLVHEHTPEPGLFAEVLTAAISTFQKRNPGVNKTEIARLAGIRLGTLYDWATPGRKLTCGTSSNMAAAGRLEAILGLPPGSLTSKMAPELRKGRRHADVAAERKRRSGKISLSLVKIRPDKLPGKIGEFFDKLKVIKTTARIVRNAGGDSIKRGASVWRVSPKSDEPVPAGKIIESRWRIYVGWLLLPDTLEGALAHVVANCRWKKRVLTSAEAKALAPFFIGKAISPDDLTPAHLVDPELMGEYIEWHKNRNGSIDDGRIRDSIALLMPESGFLAQQAECAWGYAKAQIDPVDMAAPGCKAAYAEATQAWLGRCATWTIELKGLLPFTSTGNNKTARNRLAPILDQRDLIGVVNTIIENHAADRPVGKLVLGWAGSVLLAVWVRDQLLLRMLASNPLRNRNFREMRYVGIPTQQDRGNLYRSTSGGWRLLFQPEDFKNERGAAKETYDVAIPKDIHPLIDLYLTKARPILLRTAPATDKVFVNRDGHPFDTYGLSNVVQSLTARHVQDDIDMLGFRTHAFRHIIATAWLRAHPKDYLTVAHILHDSLKTVLDNYAHDKPGDGLELYTDWLSTKMQPLNLDRAA